MTAVLAAPTHYFSKEVGAGRPITGVWGNHPINTERNYFTHPQYPQFQPCVPHMKNNVVKDDMHVKTNFSKTSKDDNNNGQDFHPLLGQTILNPKHNFAQTHKAPINDSGYKTPTTSPERQPLYSTVWSSLHADTAAAILEEEEVQDDSDSDNDMPSSLNAILHPNKFPVQIEYHDSRFCNYRRQSTRSGEKTQVKHLKTYNPATGVPTVEVQRMKTYYKHLVRVCRCGRYEVMDGALQQGRSNDCNGYEIHYNQKCRWKAYDDMVSGKRVLIRLCKCYKPTKN